MKTYLSKILTLSKTTSWKQLLSTVLHNWKTRPQLQALNEYQLKDVGLSKVNVYTEVHKKLWASRLSGNAFSSILTA